MGAYKKTRQELVEEIQLLRSRLEELGPIESLPEQAKKIFPILQRAVKQSIDGIALANIDGIIQFVNPAWAQMHGYTTTELLGKHLSMFHTEEQLINEVNPFSCQVEKKSAHQGNVGHVRKDGTTFQTWMTVTLLSDENQKAIGFLGIAHDITQHKLVEEKNKVILQTAMDSFFMTDENCNFVEVNDAYCNLTGYSRKELLTMNINDVEVLETAEDIARHADQIKKLGTRRFESCHKRKDGSIVDIDISVNYMELEGGLYFAFVRDITERKMAAKIQEKEHRQLLSIFDNMDEVIYIADPETHEMLYMNSAARKQWGDGVGSKCYCVLQNLESPCKFCTNEFIFDKNATQPYIWEFQNIANHRWYRCVDRAIEWSDKRMVRFEMATDITEHKKAMEKILEHQVRLRSLASELSLTEERERRRIAIYLHDNVNQALALAMIKLQVMCGAGEPVDIGQLDEICEAIKHAIGTMRKLTFDLSSPTLYKIGLEAAIAELLEDNFGRDSKISYEFLDDKTTKLLNDDVRMVLFRSVRELLINVAKHAQADKVMVAIAKNRNNVQITISDDGIGFDASDIKLFSRDVGGLGLLSIQERLNYIGGKLEIRSTPGKGSRFILTGPLKTETDSTKG